MRNFKKLISLVCVLVMVFSLLAGCGEKESPVTAQDPTTPQSQKENEGSGAKQGDDNEFAEKFTYQVNILHVDEAETPLLDFYRQKFNIDFELIPVTWSDWDQKVRLWAASGDMPDLMWWDLKPHQYRQFKSFAEQDIFKEISAVTDYPNLKKLADELKSDDYFVVDGKRYVWTSSRGTAHTNNLGDLGFYYRKDWAEKLGMAKDEYTWDEMLALAKAFVEKDPEGNGSGNTHGVGCIGWGFPHIIAQYIFPHITGYYVENESYVWGAAQPQALEAVKMMKKMYDEKVIWQDQLFAKSKDAENKYIAGQLGVYFSNHIINHVNRIRGEIKKAHPDIDPAKAFAPMPLKTPAGKHLAFQTPDYWSAVVFSPEMSDEKFERLLTAWDWIAGEEGFDYVTKGVKGVDWDEKDGQIVDLSDRVYSNKQLDLFRMVRLTEEYAVDNPRVDEQVRMDVKSLRDVRLDNSDTTWVEVNYDLDFFSAPNKDKYGAFDEDVKEKLVDIMAKPGVDVEAEWNNFVQNTMPKAEKVIQELDEGLLK